MTLMTSKKKLNIVPVMITPRNYYYVYYYALKEVSNYPLEVFVSFSARLLIIVG